MWDSTQASGEMPRIPGATRRKCMFEKRKRWTGWTLALAMMLSLAPQGAMAAETMPPAVQEAADASSSAAGETVGTGVEAGSSSGQEGGAKTHSQELMRQRTAQMKLYRQERMRQRTARRKTSSQEQGRQGT